MKNNHNTGDRIRTLRRLCKLSRRKMAQTYHLSEPTIRSWELGVSTISNRLLEKLIHAFHQEELHVTKNWILNGDSPEPSFMKSASPDYFTSSMTHLPHVTIDPGIQNEINTFVKNSPDRIVIKAKADFSFIEKGDILGGHMVKQNNLSHHSGRLCLVHDKHKDTFQITYLINHENTVFCVDEPLIKKTSHLKKISTLKSYAPIIWIRKPS